MIDKTFFEKVYRIGMHEVEMSEYAVVTMKTPVFEHDGIKFVFYTYYHDNDDVQRVERVIKFSFEEFMSLSIEEIFERFSVVEDELKEIFYKFLRRM